MLTPIVVPVAHTCVDDIAARLRRLPGGKSEEMSMLLTRTQP